MSFVPKKTAIQFPLHFVRHPSGSRLTFGEALFAHHNKCYSLKHTNCQLFTLSPHENPIDTISPAKRSNVLRTCSKLNANDEIAAPNAGINENIATPLHKHMTVRESKYGSERGNVSLLSRNSCVGYATRREAQHIRTRAGWHWRHQRYDRAFSSTSLRCVHVRANVDGYKYQVADKRTASKIATQCVSETTGYRLEAVAATAVAATSTAMYKAPASLPTKHRRMCTHLHTNTQFYTPNKRFTHRMECAMRCDVVSSVHV